MWKEKKVSSIPLNTSLDVTQLLTARNVVFARRLPFPPLGPAVLKPDLHSGLVQIEFERELLPRENVRVGGTLEGPLQLVQLVCREGGPGKTRTRVRKCYRRLTESGCAAKA